jgi:hypothetical protein
LQALRAVLAFGLALTLQLPLLSHAGQLSLASAPLFLGTAVEPNIFLLSDDSGSMDWDIMTAENEGRITLVGATETHVFSYTVPAADNNYSFENVGRILPSLWCVARALFRLQRHVLQPGNHLQALGRRRQCGQPV